MKKYFIALTGAKKNVGDFLITQRAISLLEHVAPEYDFIVTPHWVEFEDVSFVNNSQGIIILGGPGFQMNMYPGVYKMVKDINDINVPIYTLGCGWKGVPGDKVTEKLYSFSDSAKGFLSRINSTDAGISCRDYQTERVLKNHGYENIKMTGCPVWFDLESIGKKFEIPSKVKRVVYTPAQSSKYSSQSIKVLKFLKNKYNSAEIIVSFHRGIGKVDQYTSVSDAENTQKIADAAKDIGAKVVDVSYNVEKLNFYDECDFHVGYRVHAHIYFLSKRLPSILIHEDGRGNGVSEALKSPGINAYKIAKIYTYPFSLFKCNSRLASVYRRFALNINENIVDELSETINNIEMNKYESFIVTTRYIDEHFKVMESFIKQMLKKGD